MPVCLHGMQRTEARSGSRIEEESIVIMQSINNQPNRRNGPTPSGGDYSEIFYFNERHEIAEPEEAVSGIIRECREDGTLVQETWFRVNQEKGESAMTLSEAIDARHSVRAYKDKPIPEDIRTQLDAFVAECNEEGNLHMSVQYDDPAGFDSRLAQYGSFRNVQNYIVLAGKKEGDFDFRCGYYGEKIVLFAQQAGLNTCWAALTFNKRRVKEIVPPGDSLCMVIALGFGETQGNSRRSKTIDEVVISRGEMPDWFRRGVEAALKAPTAMNQQKFVFGMKDGKPAVKVKGIGVHTKVDCGIVAYHFEVESGRKVTFA